MLPTLACGGPLRTGRVHPTHSPDGHRPQNRQVGVFAAYATSRAHALVGRELYLPRAWTEDRDPPAHWLDPRRAHPCHEGRAGSERGHTGPRLPVTDRLGHGAIPPTDRTRTSDASSRKSARPTSWRCPRPSSSTARASPARRPGAAMRPTTPVRRKRSRRRAPLRLGRRPPVGRRGARRRRTRRQLAPPPPPDRGHAMKVVTVATPPPGDRTARSFHAARPPWVGRSAKDRPTPGSTALHSHAQASDQRKRRSAAGVPGLEQLRSANCIHRPLTCPRQQGRWRGLGRGGPEPKGWVAQ
ncbi:hypothetical protein STANM309S_06784 [Streptomyces tanashiensis]